jgi:hypothetical protein
VHEIKHDDYELVVRRDGDNVQVFTRCRIISQNLLTLPRAVNVGGPKLLLPSQKFEHTAIPHIGCRRSGVR